MGADASGFKFFSAYITARNRNTGNTDPPPPAGQTALLKRKIPNKRKH